MAEIIKTAALAVSVCVLCAVIKQYRPEYAPIVQIAAVAVDSGVRRTHFAEYNLAARFLLRDVGDWRRVHIRADKGARVAVAAQIAGDICRDNGNSAVAGVSELAAKAAIIALALPLIKSAVTLAKELINI